jgi:hypothetical protein
MCKFEPCFTILIWVCIITRLFECKQLIKLGNKSLIDFGEAALDWLYLKAELRCKSSHLVCIITRLFECKQLIKLGNKSLIDFGEAALDWLYLKAEFEPWKVTYIVEVETSHMAQKCDQA